MDKLVTFSFNDNFTHYSTSNDAQKLKMNCFAEACKKIIHFVISHKKVLTVRVFVLTALKRQSFTVWVISLQLWVKSTKSIVFKFKQWFFVKTKFLIMYRKLHFKIWNKRIRTFKYSYQKRTPYHLAIFQKRKLCFENSLPEIGIEPTIFRSWDWRVTITLLWPNLN